MISKIENKIKEINNNASDEVLEDLVQFVSKAPEAAIAIPTAVLLTGVNLPDHHSLFQAFVEGLRKDVTEHVAVLLSSECVTVKNTIEQLTSQYFRHTTKDPQADIDDSDSEEEDVFDDLKRSKCTMPNLITWYHEQQEQNSTPKKRKVHSSPGKLVIIIPDFEGFATKVLQDLILILSGYLEQLPVVLVFGVATSVKALQSSLPHRVTSRLDVRMFQSKQSVHFLNKTVNEVFLSLKHPDLCPFLLGSKIFKFLTDVFIFYDFSVQGFVQGIKYSLMEHFYKNPLSKLCCPREQLADTIKELTKSDINFIGDNKNVRTYLETLPQAKLAKVLQSKNDKAFKEVLLELIEALYEHKRHLLVTVWLLHTLVHDLPEAPLGKQVREVYVEVMSGPIVEHPKFSRSFQLLQLMSKQELLEKIDAMNAILLDCDCLENIQSELMELRGVLCNAGQNLKSPLSSPSKKRKESVEIIATNGPISSRKQFLQSLQEKKIVPKENEFEKARSKLLRYLKTDLFEKYLVQFSTLPLYETLLIDNMSVKRHIVGAPRAALHTALNNPHHYLQCKCCKISNNSEILPTMPDICIAYKLHLESGALINMYDWLQSFATIVSLDGDSDNGKIDSAVQYPWKILLFKGRLFKKWVVTILY